MKSLFEKINNKLNAQGGFLKAVSVLVGGTVFAQGIAILFLPVLTRIYSPSDFSLFAVYISLLMILSVASCLRFEIAVPMPKKDSEATHLILLALISNFLVSILIGLFIWVFHNETITLLNQPGFEKLIWLVPIGVFFSGIYNTLQYWATRKKKFNQIAKTRVVQSISGTFIQVIMGIMGFLTVGLIIGQIIKVSAGIHQLANSFWRDAHQFIKNITFKKLKKTFKENEKFPKYSTFEALANSAGVQLPIIIIAALVSGPEVGYLMLATQVMTLPMKFIGAAVAQVYLAQASDKYHQGYLKKYTIACIFKLMQIGIIPLVLISVLAPVLFPYIFGAEWKRSGDMVLWMFPWFLMQLITSPVSMSLHVAGKQTVALLLQILGFFIRVGGLLIMAWCGIVEYIFEYYALSGAVFYFIYLLIVLLTIKNVDSQMQSVTK